jgi:hypothetical protein
VAAILNQNGEEMSNFSTHLTLRAESGLMYGFALR